MPCCCIQIHRILCCLLLRRRQARLFPLFAEIIDVQAEVMNADQHRRPGMRSVANCGLPRPHNLGRGKASHRGTFLRGLFCIVFNSFVSLHEENPPEYASHFATLFQDPNMRPLSWKKQRMEEPIVQRNSRAPPTRTNITQIYTVCVDRRVEYAFRRP